MERQVDCDVAYILLVRRGYPSPLVPASLPARQLTKLPMLWPSMQYESCTADPVKKLEQVDETGGLMHERRR